MRRLHCSLRIDYHLGLTDALSIKAAFGGTALSTNGSLGFYIPCVSYKVDVYLTISMLPDVPGL